MLLRAFCAVLLMLQASCATGQTGSTVPAETPRTAGSLEPEESEFRFVVIGDRTGGHRPGVFADAMARLELLQPDFVITVGDLIEGYTSDEAEILRQWEEFESRIEVISAPMFYIAGNHDISNAAMARIWRERRGAPYWNFVHRNVLFLGLSTEDPPVQLSEAALAGTRRLEENMARDAQATQASLLEAIAKRGAPPKLPGQVNISDEQVSFVEEVLEQHPDVRWTFVVMHKPAWQYDSKAFARIETLLSDRAYTVIAGHEHYYEHEVRNGRDHIVMGTTGGVWLKNGPGRVDHLMAITMAGNGPVIANLRVDGIFPKEGQSAPTSSPDGGAVSLSQ